MTSLGTVDISFVGSLHSSMVCEVSCLQTLGARNNSSLWSYKISHLIDIIPGSLPSEITDYCAGPPDTCSLSDHFQRTRIAVLFERSSASFPDILEIAANAGCYIITDAALAQKNLWLTPHTFAICTSTSDLIDKVSEYLSSPVIDIYIAVGLAGRGQLESSIRKLNDVREQFPALRSLHQFQMLQTERLKYRS